MSALRRKTSGAQLEPQATESQADYREQYLAVLPELRARAKRNMALARLFTIPLLLLMACLGLGLLLLEWGPGPLQYSQGLLVVIGLLVLPAPLYFWATSSFARRRLRDNHVDRWREASGLADRIAAGELLHDPLLQEFKPGELFHAHTQTDDYLGHLMRVLGNSNWYYMRSHRTVLTRRNALLPLFLLFALGALVDVFSGRLIPWALLIEAYGFVLVLIALLCWPASNALSLAAYLERSWTHEQVEGRGVDPLPGLHDRARSAELQLLFNDLEQQFMVRSIFSGGQSNVFYWPIAGAILALTSGWRQWPWALLCLAVAAAFALLIRKLTWLECTRVEKALAHSDLSLQLASSQVQGEEILDYAPALLRPLLQRFRPITQKTGGLRAAISKVADNLDWYLQPPRPLLRAHWLGWVTIPASLALLYCLSKFCLSLLAATHGVITIALLCLPVLQVLISRSWYLTRQQVWRDELLRYLRAQLAQ